MSEKINFNKVLHNKVAESIPCMHMPTLMLAERAITEFVKYLENLKIEGKSSIDEVIQDITSNA